MKTTPIFLLLCFVVVVMALIHISALELSLYWQYSWLDMVVHVLGGLVIVLTVVTLWERDLLFKDTHITLLPLLLIVLSVGLAWEVFEIWAGVPITEPDFKIDTMTDLLMDLMGGAIGWFISTNPFKTKK